MKTKMLIKLMSLALVVCMALCALTACGAAEVTVKVKDMGTETEIVTSTDKTVAQALEDASITLAEKDETEPAKDTKITDSLTEITVKRYAKVTVVNGDDKKEVELVGATVEDAVKEAGFKLENGTATDVPLTDYLKDGMTITLVQGVKVEITVDGNTTEVSTGAATVEDLLKEQKITLGSDDEVSEKLDAKLTEGMKITVKRVEYKEETVTEEIDYDTEEKYSDSLASGSSEVTQEGSKGEKTVTYKVKYVDGKEASREVASEKVTKEPVNKIVTYGNASSSADNSSDNDSNNDSDNSNDAPANEPEPDDSGSDDGGKTVVDKKDVPDCDGSGHGYYIITYSDGSQDFEEY